MMLSEADPQSWEPSSAMLRSEIDRLSARGRLACTLEQGSMSKVNTSIAASQEVAEYAHVLRARQAIVILTKPLSARTRSY